MLEPICRAKFQYLLPLLWITNRLWSIKHQFHLNLTLTWTRNLVMKGSLEAFWCKHPFWWQTADSDWWNSMSDPNHLYRIWWRFQYPWPSFPSTFFPTLLYFLDWCVSMLSASFELLGAILTHVCALRSYF